MQHLQFWAGWLAWTSDAYDFFCVSLTINRLADTFFGYHNSETSHKLTTSITLTLLFRSVGALTLGVLSDRYGRKWPLILNLCAIAALQIGTSFCRTFNSFLAVRSIFGIFMGGIWGVATSSALESIPAPCRGLFSGILQQGYAVGYLIAAVCNLYAVPAVDKWEIMFWIGAGITALAAVFRLLLPESHIFLRAKAEKKASGESDGDAKTFMKSVGQALKTYWGRCIFAVVLMSFFNFFSHGSQDLYPTYMQNSKGFSSHQATIATIIGNCGAVFGGLTTGYVSQYIGRRLTIILCCIWTGAFIPLWILPNSFGALCAGAFFIQTGVQGAWGVVPIYLSEISPPAFRAVFAGLSYQLGNAASSASAQIEATAGLHLRVFVRGQDRPDYGLISAIIIGIVAFCLICCCLVGKEAKGAHFEDAKLATQAGGGLDRADYHTGQDKYRSQSDPEIPGLDAEKGAESKIETSERVVR